MQAMLARLRSPAWQPGQPALLAASGPTSIRYAEALEGEPPAIRWPELPEASAPEHPARPAAERARTDARAEHWPELPAAQEGADALHSLIEACERHLADRRRLDGEQRGIAWNA